MMDAARTRSPLPREIGEILDIAPIERGNRSEWLILASDGGLFRFDADSLEWDRRASSTIVPEPESEPWNDRHMRHRLHVSACGGFAAVVNDYGRFGRIIDLRRGVVTRELDGGDYYSQTVPFSFAFVDVGGRTLAVHRSDWNRLDISDPATGEILTERESPRYEDGAPRPAHYLDYFHGALSVSPGQTYLLSDGWIWHPIGVPTVWRIEPWYRSNTWESEDGDSKIEICARAYYWGHAICWLDEKRIAIGGIGDDDEEMIEGARIFDVTQRSAPDSGSGSASHEPLEIMTIEGPSGIFFSDGTSLFSANSAGLSRWDIERGCRTGHIAGFNPTHHHRGARELVQLVEGGLDRWTIAH